MAELHQIANAQPDDDDSQLKVKIVIELTDKSPKKRRPKKTHVEIVPEQQVRPYIVHRLETQLMDVQTELQAMSDGLDALENTEEMHSTEEQVGVNVCLFLVLLILINIGIWNFKDYIFGNSTEEERYQAKMRNSSASVKCWLFVLRHLHVPII
ncbi:uncharacterized protein LOC117903245 [Drosophila subobscura]|uniref:uncharacterized protein LOC117903245 n=1 Tax=Drosophila subobscura TaxID=7241 RepID=UPI00155AD8EB|nr:uncharacterized protein LOC117903245 [Drosophila subobscura]